MTSSFSPLRNMSCRALMQLRTRTGILGPTPQLGSDMECINSFAFRASAAGQQISWPNKGKIRNGLCYMSPTSNGNGYAPLYQ